MPTPIDKRRKTARPLEPTPDGKLFDVTCIVGSVYVDTNAPDSDPFVVAMRVIGQHHAPGEYHFPDESGLGDVVVTVEIPQPMTERGEDDWQ